MIKLKLLLSSSILALAGLSGTAQASLFSVYNGIQCQPMTELDGQNLSYFSDVLANNSNDTAYVSCPIVRRNVHNTNGTKQAYAIVSSHSGGTVRCDFQSRTQQGLQAGYNTATSSSSSKAKLDIDVNGSGALGTYTMFCILSAGSRLHSYGVEEFAVGSQVTVAPPSQPVTLNFKP